MHRVLAELSCSYKLSTNIHKYNLINQIFLNMNSILVYFLYLIYQILSLIQYLLYLDKLSENIIGVAGIYQFLIPKVKFTQIVVYMGSDKYVIHFAVAVLLMRIFDGFQRHPPEVTLQIHETNGKRRYIPSFHIFWLVSITSMCIFYQFNIEII